MINKSLLVISFVFTANFLFAEWNYHWTEIDNFPGLERDDAIMFAIDDVVYVGTGNHGGFAESNFFYKYEISNGTWSFVNEFPGYARQYATVEVIGNKAYLIGGIDLFGTGLKDVWEFNGRTEEWSIVSEFPGDSRWSAISFVIDSTIYFGTGKNHNSSFNDFWSFNPKDLSWQQEASLPTLPRNEAVGFSLFHQGYVCLGVDCTGTFDKTCWKYDPEQENWVEVAEFQGSERYYSKADVFGGLAFVAFGQDPSDLFLNDCWIYDPVSDSWHELETGLTPRRGIASCTIENHGIIFGFGLDQNYNRLKELAYLSIAQHQNTIHAFYDSTQNQIIITGQIRLGNIQLFNIRGQLVFENRTENDHFTINANYFQPGIYVIKSTAGTAKILVF